MLKFHARWDNHQIHNAKLNGCTLTVRWIEAEKFGWSVNRYPDVHEIGTAKDIFNAQYEAEQAALAADPK